MWGSSKLTRLPKLCWMHLNAMTCGCCQLLSFNSLIKSQQASVQWGTIWSLLFVACVETQNQANAGQCQCPWIKVHQCGIHRQGYSKAKENNNNPNKEENRNGRSKNSALTLHSRRAFFSSPRYFLISASKANRNTIRWFVFSTAVVLVCTFHFVAFL